MAKAREIPGLSTEDSYADAAAKIIGVRATEVLELSTGVLDVDDIERVHDMRVATRRLRAALEVFEPCFPKKRLRRDLEEVKDIADALGERRDPDVAIAALEQIAAQLTDSDRPGIESMIRSYREEQLAANERLAEYVSRDRVSSLHQRLAALVSRAGGEDGG